MKYFRSKVTGEVYAFEADGSQDGHIGPDMILMTPEQVERHITPAPTTERLCLTVDSAADRARHTVAGDPLRAVEYDRARAAAEQYATAGYTGEVPVMVAAWVTPERTAQQAANEILAEAAAYTAALELLRTTRLQAKEQIRTLMAANNLEAAQQLAAQTVAAIEQAVAGIGNNA